MKLATFVTGEQEKFGFVLTHPALGDEWVFDPERTENLLSRDDSEATKPFLEPRPWPRDMVSFLHLGDAGMNALRRLQDATLDLLKRVDPSRLAGIGYPLDQVRLRAPIPRPRFYFGLVANSATHWRHEPSRVLLNPLPA
jgi:hypothetical protein